MIQFQESLLWGEMMRIRFVSSSSCVINLDGLRGAYIPNYMGDNLTTLILTYPKSQSITIRCKSPVERDNLLADIKQALIEQTYRDKK